MKTTDLRLKAYMRWAMFCYTGFGAFGFGRGCCCVERMAGLKAAPVDYDNVPGCIRHPEIASLDFVKKMLWKGIAVNKFLFTASEKATAAGERDGFVKLVFDAPTTVC